jgi:CubicO group peptidase (beta-lactamase class C family)
MSQQSYLDGLDQVIESAMERMNVPGAAVAVVENGKPVFSKAFGYANLTRKKALKEEHLLPIGSSSKAFTATAVVMLAADGALDLDAPIRNYMPEFELFDPFASREATPRDLLCHRTGLPRHEPMWMDWSDMRRDDLIKNRLKHLKPNKPFRSLWQYQNHMFVALGYLIERVSGKPWEDFVVKRIFKPLGISDYSFRYPDKDPEGRYAKLYTPDDEGVNRVNEPLRFDAMGPAGSIILPIGELSKWLAFNLSGGKAGRKQVVDAALFSELHKPNIAYELLPFSFEERFPVGYGLGWFIDSFRGRKLVEHGGNVNGGTAVVSFLPNESVGCAVMTNADGSMFPEAFAAALYDKYLGLGDEKDWFGEYDDNYKKAVAEMTGELSAVLKLKIPDKPRSHALKEYAGTYEHDGYGKLTISAKGEKLVLRYHDRTMPLEHLHYDTYTFEFVQKMIMSLTFRAATDGSIEAVEIPFEMSMPDDPIRFSRVKKDKAAK